MNPFDILGIPAEASEREIKRAYARLLKTTRPEDDPAGFQRLHEAFQVCLHLRAHAVVVDELDWPSEAGNADDAQVHASQPAHSRQPLPTQPERTVEAGTPAAADFDEAAFLDELFAFFSNEVSPRPLRRWLRNHPDLLDISRKQALAMPVLERMLDEPPLRPGHLQVVFDFFDLEEVHVGMGDQVTLTDQLLARGIAVYGHPEVRDDENEGGGGSTGWSPFVWIQLLIALVLGLRTCSSF